MWLQVFKAATQVRQFHEHADKSPKARQHKNTPHTVDHRDSDSNVGIVQDYKRRSHGHSFCSACC